MFRWLIYMLLMSSLTGCIVPMSHRAEYEARQQRMGTLEKSRSGNYWLYKVKKHDSLFKLALRFDVTYQQLAAWNRLSPPYRINVGDVLVIREKYQPYRTPTTKQPVKVKKGQNTAIVTKQHTNTQKAQKISNSETGKSKTKSVSIRWVWPINGQVVAFFSTGEQANKGIDIAGKAGSVINAAAEGEVVYTGDSLRGYGNLVILKHAHDFLSAYGHNRKIFVKEGDYVKAGEKIAEIGSSGADVYQLHFEIRQAGTPVNPLHYLPE